MEWKEIISSLLDLPGWRSPVERGEDRDRKSWGRGGVLGEEIHSADALDVNNETASGSYLVELGFPELTFQFFALYSPCNFGQGVLGLRDP